MAAIVSLAANAQWTKPVPKGQPLETSAKCYLYNVDADAFLCGANDWGTRASVKPMHGHLIWLEKFEFEGQPWDEKSYFIWNAIEDGGMKGKDGVMFMSDASNFWVDREVTSEDAKQFGAFVFVDQGDNIYKFQPVYDSEHFIGMMPVKNDNRLYLNLEELDTQFQPDQYYTRWLFVSAESLEAYKSDVQRYNLAIALGAAIEQAEKDAPNADLAAVKAVYNDTNSTWEQLNAAYHRLAALVAGPASEVDMTEVFVVNSTYVNNNNDGWSGDAPDFQLFGNAEKWNNKVNHYQELKGLPEGVYRVQVTGYYRSGSNEVDALNYDKVLTSVGEQDFQHLKLYATSELCSAERALPLQNSGASEEALEGSTGTAKTKHGYVPNNMETAAVYTAAGQYAPTSVYAFVNDGKLTIGLHKTETVGDDWSLWDDWKLAYSGKSDAAYVSAASHIYENDVDLESLINAGEDVYYQHSAYDSYLAAKKAMLGAATADEVVSAIPEYKTWYDELRTSINVYAEFFKVFSEAKAWLEDKNSDSDEVALLADYLSTDADEGFNNRGSGDYILNNGTLDAWDLSGEIEYLKAIWSNAMANSMADGDDCTAMLKNPNFADITGWNYGDNVTLAIDNQQLMQGWNVIFDVYQELAGLQNGLYELSYNGLFRPTQAGASQEELAEKAKAFAYINNYETRIPGILDDLSEEAIAGDDANYQGQGFGPNSATGAAAHFQAGKYAARAYGLVTDGTMRIGFKNNLRTDDNCVAWVGPVKLIFRSKNADALKEVIDNTIVIVNEKLGLYCGKPELDAMSDAATFASTCEDKDLFQALITMKETIEAVDLSTEAYKKLLDALFNLDQAILGNEKASIVVINQAKALFNEAEAAYRAQSYNMDEAWEMTDQLNAMVVSILFPDENASEEEPVDYTSVIVNPTFDPDRGSKDDQKIEGWTTTAMNGYKQYTVSYNRAAFELNQKLTGLPKGKYKVKVHTYYRAGYWDEEEARVKNGEETHLTTLYAQTSAEKFETKVKNLYEDAADTDLGVNCYTLGNGKYAPDGTTPTAAFFAAGYYMNELTFTVPEDGEVTIGLSKTEVLPNDYEVVGAWELWYMGDVKASEENPVDYSSIIVNPTFDPDRGSKDDQKIEGWTTTAMNGYKQYTVSYNRAAFELNQKLTGLPKGKYMVTVHTYYRAGYWDEEEARVKNGEETHLTTLYAQTSAEKFETMVKNLYEDAADTDLGVNCYTLGNGKYAPDGTTPTAAFFAAGYYLNELRFTVPEDGEVTIGLSKTETLANDYEVVGEWKLWYMGDEEWGIGEEQDMSSLIVNNTFDPDRGSKDDQKIEGWTTSPMNGYKQYTVSYNRADIDLYQDLSGLREGTYKVTVHTYYRAGYWDEEEARVKNGEETHLTTLYAQTSDDTFETKVKNLYEDATDEPIEGVNCYTLGNGKYAPDGTTPTAAYFAAGYYLNELPFYVGTDGKVRIGLSKTVILPNDYEVVGAWNLYYYGSGYHVDELNGGGEDAIQSAEVQVAMPVGIYSLNGTRLSVPQRGINIIRMADGTVKKIMIK